MKPSRAVSLELSDKLHICPGFVPRPMPVTLTKSARASRESSSGKQGSEEREGSLAPGQGDRSCPPCLVSCRSAHPMSCCFT